MKSETLYDEYTKDQRMRLNVGIRRRLAPLMESGRRRIELMHALLFSLPGSPFLYYGDEIGMGDNIYLGDFRAPLTHWHPAFPRLCDSSAATEAVLCVSGLIKSSSLAPTLLRPYSTFDRDVSPLLN